MERALDPPLTLTGPTVGHEELSHASAAPHAGFAALYRAEYEAMIRLAFLMLGSQEQAEDVVHDALARLVERWDRVQNHGAYLRTSVMNGSRSVLRRRRLLRQHPATEFEDTDPEVDYLADLLEILSPTRRAVVVLRYFEQLTIPEIARILGVREGTVKSSLHRSLRTLRQEIQP
jgi:RNA polymerase sigma-70 factor (sigma-E family)